jgi:hypothetical protein
MRYGTDYGNRNRSFGNPGNWNQGMGMAYDREFGAGGYAGGGYGGGGNRDARYHGGGMEGLWSDRGLNRGGPFRGRGQAYDTYFRRDFLTNQGDFSNELGGGESYGYRGTIRGGGAMRDRLGGASRGYGRDLEPGYRGRGRREFGGGMRGEDRTSYGPGYGDRWESTHPEDIARRNFDRR